MEKESYREVLLKISSMISNGDAEVEAELKACLADTDTYISSHLENYNDRCMNLEDISTEDAQWLGMADILINHRYAVELDWQDSIVDFGWGISSLRTFKQLRLPLEEKFLNDDSGIDADDFAGYDDGDDEEYSYEREEESFEEQEIPYWCRYLDNQWFDEDACIGQIDIESESFVLFITEPEKLEKLEDAADMIGRRVSTVF